MTNPITHQVDAETLDCILRAHCEAECSRATSRVENTTLASGIKSFYKPAVSFWFKMGSAKYLLNDVLAFKECKRVWDEREAAKFPNDIPDDMLFVPNVILRPRDKLEYGEW